MAEANKTLTVYEMHKLIHKLYSANPISWEHWIFEQVGFFEDARVLELGCGNASFWVENKHRLPRMEVTLTDSSKEMLEAAEKNIENIMCSFHTRIVDAHAIPYEDNTFDIIMANHMIYFLSDIDKALAEMHRVLKPHGRLYATTVGKEDMQRLGDIITGFDAAIALPPNKVALRFSLENGREYLDKCFSDIEVRYHENSLVITEIDLLVNYVLAIEAGNIQDIIRGNRVEEYRRYLEYMNKTEGGIRIKKECGMFIAEKQFS
ncbi:MAG: class I SAM-dependent methyltransferase [Bacillota bacterium]